MSSAYIVTVPVSVEPITLADAKTFIRVDYTDEDTLISGLISRARSYAEMVTGRALATQTVQEIFTIERPQGGELSGTLDRGPNWYQYQEQLGANPFGAAQFYFDLSMPPIQPAQPITIQTRTTVFDTWTPFTDTYTLDNVAVPARLYFEVPVTANQWQFTFTCGYNPLQPLPFDLQQILFQMVSFWYNNREGQPLPQPIMDALMSRRIWSLFV